MDVPPLSRILVEFLDGVFLSETLGYDALLILGTGGIRHLIELEDPFA
jgi:hypothetical protein